MKAVIRKIVVKYIPLDGMTEKEEKIVRILIFVLAILALAATVAGVMHG